MELKGEKLSKQVNRLHERHKELFDTAVAFPENYEAYCAQATAERMQTAASMFRTRSSMIQCRMILLSFGPVSPLKR